jgi:hypothetical protein
MKLEHSNKEKKMSHLKKTNQIYIEIRNFFGGAMPAYKLLKSAALLIEIAENKNPITAGQMRDFWVPYTEKGVDEAMADGGWTLLSREDSWLPWGSETEVSEPHARIILKDYYGLKEVA